MPTERDPEALLEVDVGEWEEESLVPVGPACECGHEAYRHEWGGACFYVTPGRTPDGQLVGREFCPCNRYRPEIRAALEAHERGEG